jgi:hypothetical protein
MPFICAKYVSEHKKCTIQPTFLQLELGQFCHYTSEIEAGWPRNQVFNSQEGQEIFLFSTASKSALRPTQPPVQWVLGTVFPRVKQPGHEDDHSP